MKCKSKATVHWAII